MHVLRIVPATSGDSHFSHPIFRTLSRSNFLLDSTVCLVLWRKEKKKKRQKKIFSILAFSASAAVVSIEFVVAGFNFPRFTVRLVVC